MSELQYEISRMKQELRILLKEKRRAYPKDKLKQDSQIISDSLLQHIMNGHYDAVLSYMPLPGEIDTRYLHQLLRENNIPIFLPCTGEEIVFFSLSSEFNLIKGAFSILEPDPMKEERLIFDKRKRYLIIVPGLGFDEEGGRIGFGKGFYDRFLSEIRKEGIAFESIGVCPDDFIVPQIPMDEGDVEMDCISTDKNFLIIRR